MKLASTSVAATDFDACKDSTVVFRNAQLLIVDLMLSIMDCSNDASREYYFTRNVIDVPKSLTSNSSASAVVRRTFEQPVLLRRISKNTSAVHWTPTSNPSRTPPYHFLPFWTLGSCKTKLFLELFVHFYFLVKNLIVSCVKRLSMKYVTCFENIYYNSITFPLVGIVFAFFRAYLLRAILFCNWI